MKRTFVLLGVVYAHAAAGHAAGSDAASAAAPAPAYRSAFEGYRPAAEEPLADWRTINDEVARIGGHVGIMRATPGVTGHSHATPPATSGAHRHEDER